MGRKRRSRPRSQKRGDRAAGRGQNLERAQNPLPVAGVEARSGFGVADLELSAEIGAGAPLSLGANPRPHGLGHRRHVRQALGERAQVETRPADENDWPLADVGEDFARRPRPPPGGEIDRAVDRAEQAMGRATLVRDRRPRGQDAQIGIDLHRIGVDDRRPEALRERERRR